MRERERGLSLSSLSIIPYPPPLYPEPCKLLEMSEYRYFNGHPTSGVDKSFSSLNLAPKPDNGYMIGRST